MGKKKNCSIKHNLISIRNDIHAWLYGILVERAVALFRMYWHEFECAMFSTCCWCYAIFIPSTCVYNIRGCLLFSCWWLFLLGHTSISAYSECNVHAETQRKREKHKVNEYEWMSMYGCCCCFIQEIIKTYS